MIHSICWNAISVKYKYIYKSETPIQLSAATRGAVALEQANLLI